MGYVIFQELVTMSLVMRINSSRAFYYCAIGVVLLDQTTKYLARSALGSGRVVNVIPECFDLRLGYNTGGAFGVLPAGGPLFIIAALVAIYAIVRLRGLGARTGFVSAALGLLFGGAAGNLTDRIFMPELGVTDFLDFHIRTGGSMRSWPTFNIADIGIVIGGLMMVYYAMVVRERDKANAELVN